MNKDYIADTAMEITIDLALCRYSWRLCHELIKLHNMASNHITAGKPLSSPLLCTQTSLVDELYILTYKALYYPLEYQK